MGDAFAKKYDAVAFDDNELNDKTAETARKAMIAAYQQALPTLPESAPRALEMTLYGLLVGLVQVMQASSVKQGDEADSAIRTSIFEITPWAVDFARAMDGRDPLSDGH